MACLQLLSVLSPMSRSRATSTKLRPCSVTGLTASALNSGVNVLRVFGMVDSWVRAYAPNPAPAIRGEVHSDRRAAGEIGVKTSNYYLAAIKEFCTWMVRDGRAAANPLSHVSGLNAELDVRRKRRALEADEFARLVAAAASGPPVQELSGPNRAMLNVLAAWTGYRRRELASVTSRSLDLGATPATIRV